MSCAIACAIVQTEACGGSQITPVKPVVHSPTDAGVVDAAIEAGPNKLELLAAKHARLAPGTRELQKTEIDLGRDHEIGMPAFDADTCIRIAFDADAPTEVVLVDSHAMKLGTMDGTSGAIGATGPVCFHKGDTATIRFNGQSHARVVIWASP